MKKLIKTILITNFVIFGSFAIAGYDWVEPGNYIFGSCGNVSGGSVPGYSGKRYYDQWSCTSDYDLSKFDSCIQQANQIEAALRNHDTFSQCSSWLRQEVANCQSAVINKGNKWCYQLNK